MPRLLLLVALVCLAVPQERSQAEETRPNILLIMADDLGFADLGCYGSEIATPHLNQLAENGVRFSQFYNTGKCHSSRVCLLTGLYCNQAGSESLKRATTVAAELGKAGYTTSMAGMQSRPPKYDCPPRLSDDRQQ